MLSILDLAEILDLPLILDTVCFQFTLHIIFLLAFKNIQFYKIIGNEKKIYINSSFTFCYTIAIKPNQNFNTVAELLAHYK